MQSRTGEVKRVNSAVRISSFTLRYFSASGRRNNLGSVYSSLVYVEGWCYGYLKTNRVVPVSTTNSSGVMSTKVADTKAFRAV